MIVTDDGLVRIEIASDLSEVIFPASDFSLVNMPTDHEEAEDLFKNLYNTPTNRHISLVFNRHKKEDHIKALANFNNTPFTYLDSVHLLYEKATITSTSTFLPLSEGVVILHKGNTPDVATTSWFASEGVAGPRTNATTIWNVAPSEGEPKKFSYYNKLSWEVILLAMSMASPLEHRRFIYALPLDGDETSLFELCKKYNLKVQLYCENMQAANKLLEKYNKK
jgi:hypothetical protein